MPFPVQIRLSGILVTVDGIGIEVLNNTTKPVSIKDAQKLLKKRLNSLTGIETDISQWLYWRIDFSHLRDGLMTVERYHPRGIIKTCQSTNLGNIS
jgi:hypothetical protein